MSNTRKVVHCRKQKHDVYIGRPSPWGNPFSIGKDGSRTEVIAKFKALFEHSEHEHAKWMRANINQLKGKTLGCWCAPQACHGDILWDAANTKET